MQATVTALLADKTSLEHQLQQHVSMTKQREEALAVQKAAESADAKERDERQHEAMQSLQVRLTDETKRAAELKVQVEEQRARFEELAQAEATHKTALKAELEREREARAKEREALHSEKGKLDRLFPWIMHPLLTRLKSRFLLCRLRSLGPCV